MIDDVKIALQNIQYHLGSNGGYFFSIKKYPIDLLELPLLVKIDTPLVT
jgi:hypothetical protein